jgi:transposase
MANKSIKMSKLRQVLKLHCQGYSKLQISITTGLSRNTVKKYIKHFTVLLTTWEDLSRMSDKELDQLFCTTPQPAPREQLEHLHSYFSSQEKRLRQRGMTILKLWLEYYFQYPGAYSRSRFYQLYSQWKQKVKPTMHLEHKAGDKMFIDFTGEKLKIVHPETGEIKSVEVFIAILGASQLTYVEAVESQQVEDFITACERALHYFGGAPRAIVPDNLKSAVVKSNRYEPSLNENFEAFADHYGMAVLPARAYKPRDKSLVEGAVKIAYNRIYTNLPTQLSTSLEELNALIKPLLEQHNNSLLTERKYSRREQFEEMERPALQPLPERLFELRRSQQLTVMKNGHVCLSIDKHYYSVPYNYIGKKVRLLYAKSSVEIFYKYELIASHKRVRSPHNYTTDPQHLATQHQVHAEWNSDYFLQQARAIHQDVEFYINQVLLKKKHPEQAYKSCQGILSYAKRVGHGRLINACRRAHEYGLYHFKAIENILQRRLDGFEAEQEQLPMPAHENIRGENYYQ